MTRPRDGRRFDPPAGRARFRWRTTLLVVAVALELGAYVAYAVADRAPVKPDSALFEHVGWAVAHGAVPYVDVWDVKPPLVYAVTTALALVSGGDVGLLHALSGLASTVAVVGTVLLTGDLAHRLTGDDLASVVAGLVLLVPAEVYGLTPYGVRAKYLAAVFGTAGLWLALRDRPLSAGACAALAAGCWQPGGGVVLLAGGLARQRGGRRALLRLVVGLAAVTGLVLLPFLATGALVPLVVETVVAPLVGAPPFTIAGRLLSVALALGYGTVLVVPAALGWWRSVAVAPERAWWVAAGGVIFGLQVLLVDMEGALDAILWLVFLALGVGLFAASLSAGRKRLIAYAVVGLALTGPGWHLVPTAPLRPTLAALHHQAQPAAATIRRPAGATLVPDVRTILWRHLDPSTCHYRLSEKELRYVRATGGRLDATRCGRWPFGGP